MFRFITRIGLFFF
ncbi:hypothetical protein EE612_005443 [Oryza sativa]|nr:hypothetical protein EE612_005443 [Oryza sativa]